LTLTMTTYLLFFFLFSKLSSVRIGVRFRVRLSLGLRLALGLWFRAVVLKLGENYPSGIICDSSRGNTEPNHIVVLHYEQSLQKKFST